MIGPSKKEAVAVLGKRLVELRERRYFPGRLPDVLYEDLHERYLDWARPKRSFSGHYVIDAAPALAWFRGRLISSISEPDVEQYRNTH